jgi:aspartyl-tRNA(Asn)/glutamyl-tRNA(Gln) amidotransferase subunit C
MTTNEVKAVADLARLQFTDEELERFAREFSDIVEYVGVINAVDMHGVEPMTHVHEVVNVMREDVVGDCLTTEEALRNAPKKNDAFFKVPKVLG